MAEFRMAGWGGFRMRCFGPMAFAWGDLRQKSACYSPPRTSTSGRRPGVRAKRAARGVAGRQLWTGTHEKRQSP